MYLYVPAAGGGAVPMGMDKSGNGTTPTLDTWVTVPGWAPRTGYADTVIQSNALALYPGTYNLSGLITFTNDDNKREVRILRNSTALWTDSTTDYRTTVALSGAALNNVTIAAGDLISVQIRFSYSKGAVAGGVNSYLIATPV
ncbi:hypothetical protein [Rhodococcus sp. NPDC127528]|uniref:hypothetical protein n=1 Tax=unclassified Rhodococcus (in: high G+C Gram-positive bacteria) TaxID=192944 RepID=UPI00363B5717